MTLMVATVMNSFNWHSLTINEQTFDHRNHSKLWFKENLFKQKFKIILVKMAKTSGLFVLIAAVLCAVLLIQTVNGMIYLRFGIFNELKVQERSAEKANSEKSQEKNWFGFRFRQWCYSFKFKSKYFLQLSFVLMC